jgi:hypothetical protein
LGMSFQRITTQSFDVCKGRASRRLVCPQRSGRSSMF